MNEVDGGRFCWMCCELTMCQQGTPVWKIFHCWIVTHSHTLLGTWTHGGSLLSIWEWKLMNGSREMSVKKVTVWNAVSQCLVHVESDSGLDKVTKRGVYSKASKHIAWRGVHGSQSKSTTGSDRGRKQLECKDTKNVWKGILIRPDKSQFPPFSWLKSGIWASDGLVGWQNITISQSAPNQTKPNRMQVMYVWWIVWHHNTRAHYCT